MILVLSRRSICAGSPERPGGRLAPPGAGRYLQLDVVADGEALLAPAITKMGLF